MPPTPQLPFNLTHVSIVQGNSFEPYLRFTMNIKLENNGNNMDVTELYFLGIRSRIYVSTARDSKYEMGFAEAIPQSYSIHGIGNEITAELQLRLSPYLLHKIELLRDGKDLYFSLEGYQSTFANVVRGSYGGTEAITLIAKGGDPIFKYARSEWIDDLNKTEFNKVELIQVPRVEFAQIQLTTDMMKYLHAAEKAMMEGRWDDVFGECRKTINALYNGIEEWGSKLQLTKEENDALQNATGNDKTNARRNVYFVRLVQHAEKGERLNKLRNSIHNYLSLDPHEPDHKGVHFSRDDAAFALGITIRFCANLLAQLEYQLNKDKR